MKSVAEELRLLLEGLEDVDEGDEVIPFIRATAKERAEELPELMEPTKVVEMPSGPPKAIVLSFDPASAASVRGDLFGCATLFCWDGLVVVAAVTTMPRRDVDNKPLDSRSLAGLALEYYTGVAAHYPDSMIYLAVDGRGVGVGFLESLRSLGGYDLSRLSIIEIKLSGQGKTDHWPPRRDQFTQFRSWSVNTSHMVEAINADLQAGKLVCSPNLKEIEQLLDERRRYRATKTATGRTKYAAGGQGHDDRLSAVLVGAMLGRSCVRRKGQLAAPPDVQML